jgi:hypothetical protein
MVIGLFLYLFLGFGHNKEGGILADIITPLFFIIALIFIGLGFMYYGKKDNIFITSFIQYFILLSLSNIISAVFFVFILVWFVKKEREFYKEEKSEEIIEKESSIEKDSDLEDKILKASKVYKRIPYKKLAKILNRKTPDLLVNVTELVNEGKLNAIIEEPDIIFQV